MILCQHHQDFFRFHRAAFYSQLKSKVVNILVKTTTLRINLHKLLVFYPLPSPEVSYSPTSPSVSHVFTSSKFLFSHYTDTPVYVFP